MNENQGFTFLTILLFVGLLLSVGTGGYLVIKSRQKAANSPSTQQAQQELSQDKTADWKTYRNRQYGIEFEYPPFYYLTTQNAIFDDNESTVKELNNGVGSAGQWLRVGVVPADNETQSWAKELSEKELDSDFRKIDENFLKKIIEIGGRKIELAISSNYPANDAYDLTAFFYDTKNNMISLGLDKIGLTPDEAKSNPIIDALQQILSTFKFTK